jgi:hypothetical protein
MSAPQPTTCPVCGKEAEAGCLYGPTGWNKLRWRPGPPSFKGKIETGLWGCDAVGQWSIFRGPHAEGIRCKQCKCIILKY